MKKSSQSGLSGGFFHFDNSPASKDEVDDDARDVAEQSHPENACNGGNGEQINEEGLGGDGYGNVEPRCDDPAAHGIQAPKVSTHDSKDGASDHEKDFAFEVGIFIAEEVEKLPGKENRESTHEESNDQEEANDLQVASPEQAGLLDEGKTWVDDRVHDGTDDGKKASQSGEGCDVGEITDVSGKGNEENTDLAVDAVVDGAGELAFNEGDKKSFVFGIDRGFRVRQGGHPLT